MTGLGARAKANDIALGERLMDPPLHTHSLSHCRAPELRVDVICNIIYTEFLSSSLSSDARLRAHGVGLIAGGVMTRRYRSARAKASQIAIYESISGKLDACVRLPKTDIYRREGGVYRDWSGD